MHSDDNYLKYIKFEHNKEVLLELHNFLLHTMVDIKCHQWWIIYVSILQSGCNLLIKSQLWKGYAIGIDFYNKTAAFQ